MFFFIIMPLEKEFHNKSITKCLPYVWHQLLSGIQIRVW